MNARERKALGGRKATPVSADETPYFNMEGAPVVWLEDQGSHSSHLTKAPTLHSSVKEEGGEKAAGKKITESAGRFIAFKGRSQLMASQWEMKRRVLMQGLQQFIQESQSESPDYG